MPKFVESLGIEQVDEQHHRRRAGVGLDPAVARCELGGDHHGRQSFGREQASGSAIVCGRRVGILEQGVDPGAEPRLEFDLLQLSAYDRVADLSGGLHDQQRFIAEIGIERRPEVGLLVGPVEVGAGALEVQVGVAPEGIVDNRAQQPVALGGNGLVREEARLGVGVVVDAQRDMHDGECRSQERESEQADHGGEDAASEGGV